MDYTIKKPINLMRDHRKDTRRVRLIFCSILIIAIGGASGSLFFYMKYDALRKNPDLEAKKETEALVLAAGTLMELPQNEIPTVAVISNKEKLKGQPFFKNAENGDRLLAYNTAMIAVLYRPRTNKIINIAPISLN